MRPVRRPGGLQPALRVGVVLTAFASVLAVAGSAGGAPAGGAESCLSQPQRPCGFRYDVTWNVTWRYRKAPAPDINTDGFLKVTFPRVLITGGIYGGRVQMSSQTQTPRVARIGLAVSTPGCEPSQEYSRPVTLQMSTGSRRGDTFFAGFRPVRTLDPLSKCEEPSQVPLSSLAQWDAGCTGGTTSSGTARRAGRPRACFTRVRLSRAPRQCCSSGRPRRAACRFRSTASGPGGLRHQRADDEDGEVLRRRVDEDERSPDVHAPPVATRSLELPGRR